MPEKTIKKQTQETKSETTFTKEEIKKMNLWQKLNEIQNNTEIFVEKNGKNEIDNYDYKKLTDILKALKGQFYKFGIVIVLKEATKEELNFNISTLNSYNQNLFLSYHLQKFALVNIDQTTEELVFSFPISAIHNDASKTIATGYTYALKTILSFWGMLPDESLDPDTTENTKTAKTVKSSPAAVIQPLNTIKTQATPAEIMNEYTRILNLVKLDATKKAEIFKITGETSDSSVIYDKIALDINVFKHIV